MPIINSDNFPFIDTSQELDKQLVNRSSTAVWNLKKWDKHDYWYCELTAGDAFKRFPIESLMSTSTLDKIKDRNSDTFLVVCNSHEAFHFIIEPLYQSLVIKSEIPPKKIILMSESADVHHVVTEVANRYKKETFQVEWTLIFEEQIKQEARFRSQKLMRDYNTGYTKKFLSLNRRWRFHRVALVAFLKSLDLINQGFVSLGASDDKKTWSQLYPWLLTYHKDDADLYNLLVEHKEDILNIPELYLDTTDLVTNRPELSKSLDSFYKNSYFSIITETNYYTSPDWQTGRFFSEKIFKPIAQRHPFILLSNPKSLELLRELGYKTYGTVINEDYDNELDDVQRLKKVLIEVRKLCQLSKNDVKNFVDETKHIAEFNFRKLTTRNIHCYKKM